MNYKWLYACLGTCVLIIASSCGKKDAASTTTSTGTTSATNAGTPQATAAPSEAEIIVSTRSLDYVQGLIEHKDFQRAKDVLAQAEARPLTAAQRQRAQALKAQLPK